MSLIKSISVWLHRDSGQFQSVSSWDNYLANLTMPIRISSGDEAQQISPPDFFSGFWGPGTTYSVQGIRIGSEFCFRLMPSESEMLSFMHLADKTNVKLQIVFPPLSVTEFSRFQDLLHLLSAHDRVELIVNDIGTLSYLQSHRNMKFSAGRILWKQKRIARFGIDEFNLLGAHILDEYRSFEVATWLREFDVFTVEIDWPPQGLSIKPHQSEIVVHYPCCLVAMSRICPIGSSAVFGSLKFTIDAPCRFECREIKELHISRANTSLIRIGKAVFCPAGYSSPSPDCTDLISGIVLDTEFLL